jgi:hypothetical protein
MTSRYRSELFAKTAAVDDSLRAPAINNSATGLAAYSVASAMNLTAGTDDELHKGVPSCDIVDAGAFSLQAPSQVPSKQTKEASCVEDDAHVASVEVGASSDVKPHKWDQYNFSLFPKQTFTDMVDQLEEIIPELKNQRALHELVTGAVDSLRVDIDDFYCMTEPAAMRALRRYARFEGGDCIVQFAEELDVGIAATKRLVAEVKACGM